MLLFRATLVAALVLLAAAPCAARQKSDIVVLRSGDRITCEIKSLQYGYLQVETDSLGTLNVVWADVGQLTSIHHFVVEDFTGQRFDGSLRSPAVGQLEVVGATTSPLTLLNVVTIRQDRASFWQRVDGSVEVSFNLARANDQKQWALNANGDYSGLSLFSVVTFNSMFTTQEGVRDTSRNSFNIQSGRFLGRRWIYAGVGNIQQDDELGLTLRVAGGAGIGRQLIESNRRALEMLGGLLVTNERFEDVAGTQTNLESYLLTRYEGFRRRSPKLDIITSFVVLPSLTQAGRVRGELTLSASIEVIHNFYVGLNGFHSFDSRPPDPSLPNHDYGITPSLRWKF
jgi:Protein of unknown function, DUF481.